MIKSFPALSMNHLLSFCLPGPRKTDALLAHHDKDGMKTQKKVKKDRYGLRQTPKIIELDVRVLV